MSNLISFISGFLTSALIGSAGYLTVKLKSRNAQNLAVIRIIQDFAQDEKVKNFLDKIFIPYGVHVTDFRKVKSSYNLLLNELRDHCYSRRIKNIENKFCANMNTLFSIIEEQGDDEDVKQVVYAIKESLEELAALSKKYSDYKLFTFMNLWLDRE